VNIGVTFISAENHDRSEIVARGTDIQTACHPVHCMCSLFDFVLHSYE